MVPIRMSQDLVRLLERQAASTGQTRSAVLRGIVRDALLPGAINMEKSA